jgi:hypothetical protein
MTKLVKDTTSGKIAEENHKQTMTMGVSNFPNLDRVCENNHDDSGGDFLSPQGKCLTVKLDFSAGDSDPVFVRLLAD